MYKILVFSDTHKNCDSCIETINKNPDTNLIMHAGDCVDDAEELSYIFSNIPVEFVRGNNDYFSFAKDEKLLHIQGKKFLLTHGHSFGVKSGLHALNKRAIQLGADVVVFGHTHTPLLEKIGDIIFLNPGASRSVNAKYGEIIISDGKIDAKILSQD